MARQRDRMKAPAIQFYVKDWLADLSGHPLDVVGAWINILCKAHLADERGLVTMAMSDWTLFLGPDADRVLEEIHNRKIGLVVVMPEGFDLSKNALDFVDVTTCNGLVTGLKRLGNALVTVACRRMLREEKAKDSVASRVAKHRESKRGNASVTPNVTPNVTPKYMPSASASASAFSLTLNSDLDVRTKVGGNIQVSSARKDERAGLPANAEAQFFSDIVAAYHQILGHALPKVLKLTKARASALRERIREDAGRNHVAWWQWYFREILGRPHLMGVNERKWTADFEWLIQPRNMLNILEGKYKRGASAPAAAKQPAREFKNEEYGQSIIQPGSFLSDD